MIVVAVSTLTTFLLWLDALPARYWSCVYVTTGLVLLSALLAYFRPQTLLRWNRPALFAALLGIALFAFRWPILFDNHQENNPDESQMIAGAIVLRSEPVFWKVVDGTTHGPLVQLPLAALGALGMRLDFTNARIVSAVLIWLLVVSTWLCLRVPFGDGLARVLILPVALLEISTCFWDFNQYSSEHVPIALLAISAWLIVSETLGGRPAVGWRLGLAGVLLGSVPFAKLQGTPLGLWLGAAALALIVFDSKTPLGTRGRLAAWLIGGALVVPSIFLGTFLVHGILTDFWISYITTNLLYADAYPMRWSTAPQFLASLVRSDESTLSYFVPLGYILLTGTIARIFLPRIANRRFTVLALGLLGLSIYATLAPNRAFTHYLQFIIAPLALAVGAVVGAIITRYEPASRPKEARAHFVGLILVALYMVSSTGLLLTGFRYREPPHLGRFTATHGKLARSSVADVFLKITSPADSIAMWGWEPRYFVEANRRHATREAHSALEIFQSSSRDYYRSRYLADMIRSEPAVFADMVGPGAFCFEDRTKFSHETFPELAKLVANRYRLVGEIGPARIYLRNDRPFGPFTFR